MSREILQFSWVACATPDYLEKNGIPYEPDDLADHSLIGFRNRASGQIDSWRFQSATSREYVHVAPAAKYIFDDAESAWNMACAGIGIVWAPDWLAREDLLKGRVHEVLKSWRIPSAPLFAVRLHRKHTPIRTIKVMEYIAMAARDTLLE